MDDLLEEFVAETRETLEALAGEIVAWEANPTDRARLDAIFRFVHTVKGSCGFLDLPRLARLSHAAEDVLSAVRDGIRTPDPGLVNAVLAIVDRIGEIVEAIDAGAALDDTGEDLLIAALDVKAEPIEAALPSAATIAATRAPTRSVRLSVDLLDRMMSGMSEMVLARNELARRLRDAEADPASEAALERLSLTVADMRETVTRTRMQTIDALFSALPRMVRDTATALGKHVQLTIEGGDVELDREMIEMMRDPLVHIVRNSIDHGLETGMERHIAGKPEIGRLTVRARQSGNTIVIEVSDDGQGIDTERLVAKLIAGGRDPAILRQMPEKDRLALVFEPGLSSRDEVTAISGRGVGMDVVRANIEQIGGRIDLDNRPGRGLTLSIHVPLTLSILPTIVVGACGQRFALARQAIEEIVPAGGVATRIDAWGDGHVATIRDRRMPLVDLTAMLGLDGGPIEARAMLVIVSVAGGSMALAVDDVLDSEELVIKPAAPAVMASGLYAGQTLPDTGLPMLVLDAAGIATAAGLNFAREIFVDDTPMEVADTGIEALMFVDRDDMRRAIPLVAVDRVDQVSADAISFAAGRNRLTIDGRIIPLVIRAPIDTAEAAIHIIRLSDGITEIGYAVRETCGIVSILAEVNTAGGDGDIAGLALVDGRPVELIDAHWLFAELGEGGEGADRPLCLLSGEGGWMGTFLAPVLERAGYRVATSAGPGETAVAMLAMSDEDDFLAPFGIPVVRLSDRRDGGGIFRYDRRAVLAAVAGAAA